jgi:hypothetical protein
LGYVGLRIQFTEKRLSSVLLSTSTNKDMDMSMDAELIEKLGPLGPLAGTWEGDQGIDIAPTPNGAVESHFRERMVLDPFGPVSNREQDLYALRYSTTAWRIGEDEAFHEELGYWLWDPANCQVIRTFMVPRGVCVMAGGRVEPGARSFRLAAEAGSEVYGALSNPFLYRSANTDHYEVTVTLNDDGTFSYEEDTVLNFAPLDKIFHHTDGNTLSRVS